MLENKHSYFPVFILTFIFFLPLSPLFAVTEFVLFVLFCSVLFVLYSGADLMQGLTG